MNTIQAILDRHSVRDFSAKTLAKDTVMKILEVATYSPSGGNGQPWEVFVAAGMTMEKIRKKYQERGKEVGGSLGPPNHPNFILERMVTIRKERMELLGLDPKDPASGRVFLEWSNCLYGTPVMVIVCMDKQVNSFLDIGLFVQTICIAAKDHGVDSLIAQGYIAQPDILRQELGIDDNLNIIIGLGLGYPNPDSIINTYRSPRRPIHEVVRYIE